MTIWTLPPVIIIEPSHYPSLATLAIHLHVGPNVHLLTAVISDALLPICQVHANTSFFPPLPAFVMLTSWTWPCNNKGVLAPTHYTMPLSTQMFYSHYPTQGNSTPTLFYHTVHINPTHDGWIWLPCYAQHRCLPRRWCTIYSKEFSQIDTKMFFNIKNGWFYCFLAIFCEIGPTFKDFFDKNGTLV